MTDIDIMNLPEVKKALQDIIDKKMKGTVLAKALRKGATPIAKSARRNAVKAKQEHYIRYGKWAGATMSGNLQRSIGIVTISKYPPVAYVGPSRGSGKKWDAYWANWIEKGTKERRPKGEFMTFESGGRWHKLRKAKGIIARPFLSPAWQQNKTQTIEIIRKTLSQQWQ